MRDGFEKRFYIEKYLFLWYNIFPTIKSNRRFIKIFTDIGKGLIMNAEERKLNEILSKDGDVVNEILQMCEDFDIDEMISLNYKIQNELRERLATNPLEEDVWDCLLSIMKPDELSEDVLRYLIQNRISLMTLCHMQLHDKWLIKLTAYDEAPVYTLAERYYLSDKYSSLDFFNFYNQYLRNRDDVSLHLLDVYGKVDKRGLLIFLCSNNKEFEGTERLQWYRVADQVQGITNSTDIKSIYKEYQTVGIVLAEIANNYFTPREILLELLSVKGILYANKIRKNSDKTLKLKQLAEQKH